MSEYVDTSWCAGCGAEIFHAPYVAKNQNYCCQNCALGYACHCGQAMEREDDYRDADSPVQSIFPGEAYLSIL